MVLRRYFWERHSNKWSGWTRFLSVPAIMISTYCHSRTGLLISILFTVVNPFLFPKPQSTDNWMSKAVLGEQIWVRGGFKKDFPQILNLINGPIFGLALVAACKRRPRSAVVASAASIVLKLWFLNEMVKVYERRDQAGRR